MCGIRQTAIGGRSHGFPVTHAIPSQHHLSVGAAEGVAPALPAGVTLLSRARPPNSRSPVANRLTWEGAQPREPAHS